MADPVVQLTHLWWPPAFWTSLWWLVQRTSLLFPTSFEPTGTPRSFFKVQWRDRNWIGQTQSANEQPISHRVLGIAIQNKSISCLFLPVYSMFWLNSLLMFFFSPARVRFEHRTYSEFERTRFVFKPNVYPIDSIHVQF